MFAFQLIAIAVGMVLTTFALRWWLARGVVVSIPILGAVVIATGTALGYNFFHRDIGPVPITLDRLLLGFMAVWYAVAVARGKLKIPAWNRLDIALAVLLVMLAISTLTHNYGFRDNLPLSRLLFFNLLPISLYFIVRSSGIRSWELRRIQWIFGGLGVYLGITAVFEVMGFHAGVFPRHILDPEYFEFLGRGRGPLLNPVANGMFMTVGALCLGMRWPDSSRRFKIVLAFCLASIAVGVVCTLTRSVWLGFLLAWFPVIWVVTTRRQKGLIVCAAAFGLVLISCGLAKHLMSFKRDREVSVAQMQESARLRPIFAEVAWRMFLDRPIWGCGFGQYTREKITYLDSPDTARVLSKAKPYMQHNVVLSYLTETGLAGAGWLLIVIGLMVARSRQLWRAGTFNSVEGRWSLVMSGFLITWFINGMLHDVSIIPMVNMMLLYLAAVTNRLVEELSRTPRVTGDQRAATGVQPRWYRGVTTNAIVARQ